MSDRLFRIIERDSQECVSLRLQEAQNFSRLIISERAKLISFQGDSIAKRHLEAKLLVWEGAYQKLVVK